jgi:hypothetical protein
MMTDSCNCGKTPKSHAHYTDKNGKEKLLFWRGIPVVKDEVEDGEINFSLNDRTATGWTGSYATYTLNGGRKKCGWCHKDLSRLGFARLDKHLKKHEKKNTSI